MPSDAAVVHVVDDDEAMRQSMAFLLRTANIQVQTYEAAADFLNALSQAKAGCVVTDVRKDGRNLSGKRHDQNAGGKSLRFGSDGTGWGYPRSKRRWLKEFSPSARLEVEIDQGGGRFVRASCWR